MRENESTAETEDEETDSENEDKKSKMVEECEKQCCALDKCTPQHKGKPRKCNCCGGTTHASCSSAVALMKDKRKKKCVCDLCKSTDSHCNDPFSSNSCIEKKSIKNV